MVTFTCDPQRRTFPLLAEGSVHLMLVPVSPDTLRRFYVAGREAVMGTISPKATVQWHSAVRQFENVGESCSDGVRRLGSLRNQRRLQRHEDLFRRDLQGFAVGAFCGNGVLYGGSMCVVQIRLGS